MPRYKTCLEYLQGCELVGHLGHLVEEEGGALPALPRAPAVGSQQKQGQQSHLEKCKSTTPLMTQFWPRYGSAIHAIFLRRCLFFGQCPDEDKIMQELPTQCFQHTSYSTVLIEDWLSKNKITSFLYHSQIFIGHFLYCANMNTL